VNVSGTWSSTDLAIVSDVVGKVNVLLTQYGAHSTSFQGYTLSGQGTTTLNLVGSNTQSGYPSPYFTAGGTNGGGTIMMQGNYTGTTDDDAQRKALLTDLLLHEFGHSAGFADTSSCGFGNSVMFESIPVDAAASTYLADYTWGDNCQMLEQQVSWGYVCNDLDKAACGMGTDYWVEETCTCVTGTSPILISVRRAEFRLTSLQDGVVFDIDADGNAEQVAWTRRGEYLGFLVLDRNGNGRIDDGSEMFGDHSPQPESPAKNGFKALAELDLPANGGNGNGFIDAGDSSFAALRIWIDVDHDGISEEEELLPLSRFGVYALSFRYAASKRTDEYGNRFRYRARVYSHLPGTGEWAWDVYLVTAVR
jgi:hypothetical protein